MTSPFSELTLAVDEIYRLRQLLAYEAQRIRADLDMATYPKSRRKGAERLMEKLEQAACGQIDLAVADMNSQTLRRCLEHAGADATLTNDMWANQMQLRYTRGER